MELIKAESIPEAWLDASKYLMSQKDLMDFDVFLNIKNPLELSKKDALVLKEIDDFFTAYGGYPVNAVAETIFPFDEYLRNGKDGVFELYPPKIRKIQKARSDGRWGNYALRMLRQVDRDGSIFNPLKELVSKIEKASKYRACYEIGLGRAPAEDDVTCADIPVYDGTLDRKQYYGGLPCMSHLSVKVFEGKILFNATYRAHNYMQRLVGNLIGLARLQYFVARETGHEVGSMSINSTLARLDVGSDNSSDCKWKKSDIQNLIIKSDSIYKSPNE